MERSKPAMERGKPAMERSKPAMERGKPAMERGKPAMERSKPAMERSKPAMERGRPAMERSRPAEERANPAEECSKPAPALAIGASTGNASARAPDDILRPFEVDIPARPRSGAGAKGVGGRFDRAPRPPRAPPPVQGFVPPIARCVRFSARPRHRPSPVQTRCPGGGGCAAKIAPTGRLLCCRACQVNH
jgi:hypothetical protein